MNNNLLDLRISKGTYNRKLALVAENVHAKVWRKNRFGGKSNTLVVLWFGGRDVGFKIRAAIPGSSTCQVYGFPMLVVYHLRYLNTKLRLIVSLLAQQTSDWMLTKYPRRLLTALLLLVSGFVSQCLYLYSVKARYEYVNFNLLCLLRTFIC